MVFSRKKQDDEKVGYNYENDSARLTKAAPLSPRISSNVTQQRYLGSFAPNPSFIRLLRFLLYTLTSGAALATAGFGIGVLQYYNSRQPSIAPAWGSLIAAVIFGIGTPGVLFGLFLVTPRLFRHGGVGAILNQTRIELLMLFTLSVFWISGALAVAVDLRGFENCLWDGYFHYPKPADFLKVCYLINYTVIFGYITFGLCAIQMVIITTAAIYILLFLDQEVLTELTNDMGGRAYRARLLAIASHRSGNDGAVSTSGPRSGDAPMSGGSLARTSSRNLPTSQEREVGDERVQRTRYRDDDEEVEEEETEDEEADDDDATQRGDSGAAYYGFGGAPKTNNSLKAPQFI